MASNRLQLNSDKTECLWLRARKFDHLYFPDLCAGHAIIKPAKHARNLGFYFDEHLEFQPQINNLSKGCFYQLRQIRSIAKHLDSDVIKSILQAFVASRLDYCNVLYGHLPAYRIQQIQRIQNAAARIFCYRHDHHITLSFVTTFTGYPSDGESSTRLPLSLTRPFEACQQTILLTSAL